MRKPILMFGLFAAFALAASLVLLTDQSAQAGHGGADSFSIDMDPSMTPANDGSSFGTIETCARINENDIMDADEIGIDLLGIDVIVDNIPASNPAIGTNFAINFPTPNVTVNETSTPYATAHGWTVIPASDPPQNDGDFSHSVIDILATGTDGSGTIGTLTLETAAGVTTGEFPLTLTEVAHIDTAGAAQEPHAIGDATVAIDVPCGSGTPTPIPTPGPTFTSWGDDNCSGSVSPVDALLTLRFDAFLGADTGEMCPDFGDIVDVVDASPHIWGDVNCSGEVSPADATVILRFDAKLNIVQPEGCPAMGTNICLTTLSPPMSPPLSPPIFCPPPISPPILGSVGMPALVLLVGALMVGATAGFMRIAGTGKPEDE